MFNMQEHLDALKALARSCSAPKLHRLLRDMYASEQLFLRTTAQHLLLEMLFIRLAQRNDSEGGSAPASAQSAVTVAETKDEYLEDELDEDVDEDDDEIEDDCSFAAKWKQFARAIETSNEPMLASVFKQGVPTAFNSESGQLTVELARDLSFLIDVLEENKDTWHPLLTASYGREVSLIPQFVREPLRRPAAEKKLQPAPQITTQPTAQKPMYSSYQKQRPSAAVVMPREDEVDVSDAIQWPKAHLLLKNFFCKIYFFLFFFN